MVKRSSGIKWSLFRKRVFRIIVISILLILLLIYICFNDPIHYIATEGWKNPCDKLSYLSLNSNTLFLGDLHIKGYYEERFKGIRSFILENNVSNLILVGDVFDNPEIYYNLREELGSDKAIIYRLLEILDIEDLKLNIYFILGGASHDPQDISINITINNISFQTVGKCLRIKIYNHKIIATHGDIIVSGPFSFVISRIFNKPLFEELLRSVFNIDKDTWVIMGHTHNPIIDYKSKVANTGGWTKTPILQPPTKRGILVTREGVMLVKVGS